MGIKTGAKAGVSLFSMEKYYRCKCDTLSPIIDSNSGTRKIHLRLKSDEQGSCRYAGQS